MLGWIFWGVIMAALLVLALILHWLAGKRQQAEQAGGQVVDNALLSVAAAGAGTLRQRTASAESSHTGNGSWMRKMRSDFVEGRIDLGAVLTITQVA